MIGTLQNMMKEGREGFGEGARPALPLDTNPPWSLLGAGREQGGSRLWRGQSPGRAGRRVQGNCLVGVFIGNGTYGYMSEDRFTGAIHPA